MTGQVRNVTNWERGVVHPLPHWVRAVISNIYVYITVLLSFISYPMGFSIYSYHIIIHPNYSILQMFMDLKELPELVHPFHKLINNVEHNTVPHYSICPATMTK